MGDDNQIMREDVKKSEFPKAQDVSKEPQQLSELSKPKSYGTSRLVGARTYKSIKEEPNE